MRRKRDVSREVGAYEEKKDCFNTFALAAGQGQCFERRAVAYGEGFARDLDKLLSPELVQEPRYMFHARLR